MKPALTVEADLLWMRIAQVANVVVAVMPDGKQVMFDTKMIEATADKIAAMLPPIKARTGLEPLVDYPKLETT